MPSPAEPSRLWRRACLLFMVLVFCRGLAALCVLPPFEGWDEYQHVGYIEYVRENGRRPVLGEASVPPALAASALSFPHPSSVVRDMLGALGAVDYDGFWARHDPRDPAPKPPAPGGVLVGGGALYQAQHGPLYYQMCAPLFSRLGGVGNLRASLGGLRLVNLALTVAAVGLVAVLARRLLRSGRDAALVALPLAAHPLFLLNGARVANDALGLLLATAAVALGFTMVLGRRPVAVGLALGLVAGLAAAVKATNLALLPFLAACWLVSRRGVSARVWLCSGLALATGWLLPLLGDLRFDLAHYGLPTAMQEAVINRRAGRTAADLARAARSIPWESSLRRLWVRELFFKGGWSFLRTHPVITQAYQAAVSIGLAGWFAWGIRRLSGRRDGVFVAPAVPWLLASVVLGYTTALAYHTVQSTLAWGAPTTSPWYACPALPWFLALAVVGGFGWTPGRLKAAVPMALALAGLAGEFAGVWGQMIPTYSGGADGFEALRRLAYLQPPALGTATLFAALAGEVLAAAALVLTLRDLARSEARRPAAPWPGAPTRFSRRAARVTLP